MSCMSLIAQILIGNQLEFFFYILIPKKLDLDAYFIWSYIIWKCLVAMGDQATLSAHLAMLSFILMH